MKPRHLLTAAVAAVLTAGCSSALNDSSDSGGDSSGTMRVGLLVPTSGVYAALGADMKNGFNLYLEQHGNKLGGRSVKVYEADEGAGPETGVPAAAKLVQQDQVGVVVGVVNSAVALGVRTTFVEAKVPLIIANAGADALTATPSPYVWRTSFSNGAVNAAMGADVAKSTTGKSVYLLAPDYAAGHEQIAGFKKTFLAAGGKVAGERYSPFGTTQDFQPYLSAAQQSGAAAIYAFYAGAEAVAFVKQYKAFGLSAKLPLYGPGFLTEGGVLAAQGDAALGVQTGLQYSNQLSTPANKAFVTAYQDAYHALPSTYAVQAYDAAAVLDKAAAKGSGGSALATALESVGTVDSPRGRWHFDAHHDPAQQYYLRKVERVNGQFANVVVGPLTG
jgi:branched-chain amino acid transport system substrate-binding protein